MSDSVIRLDDEQMRRFICDGVLVLDSVADPGLHKGIRAKVEWVHKNVGYADSNILPRISELQVVLDSPAVKGALQSILGDEYMQHPMRAMVPSEPLAPEQRDIALRGDEDGPPMGEGSRSYSYWHKDTYAPLGRARYHVPRSLFLFYFPQDTPLELGPTRVIPGSQYQDHITEDDHAFAYVPDRVRAGSCVLTAYDINHAGMSNLSDVTRYMVKFIFLRTRNPQGPSWNGGSDDWRPPSEHLGRYEHPQTWSYIWNWMRGSSDSSGMPAAHIDEHLSYLNGTEQQQRLAAIYSLGAMGDAAVEPLINSLLSVAGLDRIEPPYVQKEDGSYETRGDPLERRWTEGGYIFQDEAYALGCLGAVAVDPLIELLDHDDPWIVMNAAFALGQVGTDAARAVPKLSALLYDSDHRVVRAVLESIGCIGSNSKEALPAISNLLRTRRDAWKQDLKLDYLVGDQIHFNAVLALLLSDLKIDEMEDLLIDLVESPAPNVCVPAIALEILVRHGGTKGMRRALRYMQTHRWDDYQWPESVREQA